MSARNGDLSACYCVKEIMMIFFLRNNVVYSKPEQSVVNVDPGGHPVLRAWGVPAGLHHPS